MLFSSIPFLYGFLPVVLILYFAVPKRGRNAVLLAASLFFYGWGEPRFLIFMVLTILAGYVAGLRIDACRENRRAAKSWLVVFTIFCLGILGVCKYADFFLENFRAITGLPVPLLRIALPIGISFYTFQILSYAVDVYRGTAPVQKNLISLGTYIALFPQLIAGPIVRYADLEAELRQRQCTLDDTAEGFRRFSVGLAKKVVLANTLGELVQLFRAAKEPSVLFVWMYAFAFTLQVYFDFSGYSDMAIGLGRIFGFHFMENFRYPYTASSITDFWRRWHISLGTWFRDYLYIPLGGNRVSRYRWIFNIMVVWMATGLWHGASWNFVAWGLFYGLLLIIEKWFLGRFLEKCKGLRHIYVLVMVVMGFVLFDAASLGGAMKTIQSMLGVGGLPAVTAESLYYLKSYGFLLILAALGATPLPYRALERLLSTRWGKAAGTVAVPLGVVALLLVSTAFLVEGSFNPFLYFRF